MASHDCLLALTESHHRAADGRLRIDLGSETKDFRFTVHPSYHGQVTVVTKNPFGILELDDGLCRFYVADRSQARAFNSADSSWDPEYEACTDDLNSQLFSIAHIITLLRGDHPLPVLTDHGSLVLSPLVRRLWIVKLDIGHRHNLEWFDKFPSWSPYKERELLHRWHELYARLSDPLEVWMVYHSSWSREQFPVQLLRVELTSHMDAVKLIMEDLQERHQKAGWMDEGGVLSPLGLTFREPTQSRNNVTPRQMNRLDKLDHHTCLSDGIHEHT